MTLKGGLAIIFGILTLVLPEMTIFSVVRYFGILIMISGLMIIAGAIMQIKNNSQWLWWLIEGVFDIAIGIFIFVKLLWASAFISIVLGLWVLVIGIAQIITAFKLKSYMYNWWILIFSGLICIMLSALVFTDVFAGKLAKVTIIGIFTLVFGLLTIYVSRKLKNLYHLNF